MKTYFRTQASMLSRVIKSWGILPIVGYPLLIVLFFSVSWWLFSKSEYTPYIYVLLALFLPGKLAEARRNEFLEICFGTSKYRVVRLSENLIVVCPFVFFLFFKQFIYLGILLVGIALVFSLFRLKVRTQRSIPTPFPKHSFEFITGFRKTFIIIGLSYLIGGIAIAVGNFNLGIMALVLLFILLSAYYSEVEQEYFVWQYHVEGGRFLWEKTKAGFLCTAFLVLPLTLTMGVFFVQQLMWLLIFLLGGYLFLLCIIFMKYTRFPAPFGLLQVVMLAFGLLFPPLLIAIIFYFAYQSIKQLNVILK